MEGMEGKINKKKHGHKAKNVYSLNIKVHSYPCRPSFHGAKTDPLSNLYLFHAGVNLMAKKMQAVAMGRIVRGLILANFALYLISCGGPVEFGFPFSPV